VTFRFASCITEAQSAPSLTNACSKSSANHFLLENHRSLITHLDMHHLVFGIIFQIHLVSLTILVSIHRLIHLSTHLSHYSHSHHPSLLHSFTAASQPTFSTNPSHLNRLSFTYSTVLMIIGLDRTYHDHQFILVSHFIYFCLFRVAHKAGYPSSFLLHVKYTLSYRINQSSALN